MSKPEDRADYAFSVVAGYTPLKIKQYLLPSGKLEEYHLWSNRDGSEQLWATYTSRDNEWVLSARDRAGNRYVPFTIRLGQRPEFRPVISAEGFLTSMVDTMDFHVIPGEVSLGQPRYTRASPARVDTGSRGSRPEGAMMDYAISRSVRYLIAGILLYSIIYNREFHTKCVDYWVDEMNSRNHSDKLVSEYYDRIKRLVWTGDINFFPVEESGGPTPSGNIREMGSSTVRSPIVWFTTYEDDDSSCCSSEESDETLAEDIPFERVDWRTVPRDMKVWSRITRDAGNGVHYLQVERSLDKSKSEYNLVSYTSHVGFNSVSRIDVHDRAEAIFLRDELQKMIDDPTLRDNFYQQGYRDYLDGKSIPDQ